MISFNTEFYNQLLISPKLSPSEKNVIFMLKSKIDATFGEKNFFLVTSSGSSKNENQSVKLMALSKESVLNSARRFNEYFLMKKTNNWGLVLPDFHVAGLSVRARAFLTDSKVFSLTWQVEKIQNWIEENQISHMSLVPSQVFDIVKINMRCPDSIELVLVGGGALTEDLRQRFLDLGWKFIETYGMTETSSLIAYKSPNHSNLNLFKVLPGVKLKVINSKLKIKCDSLIHGYVQIVNGELFVFKTDEIMGFECEDLVDLQTLGEDTYLKFIGRSYEYVKVLGEGVSLAEVEGKVRNFAKQLEPNNEINFWVVALPDERRGFRLTLVIEQQINEEPFNNILNLYNDNCRPYERILSVVKVSQIPYTSLGKVIYPDLVKAVANKVQSGG